MYVDTFIPYHMYVFIYVNMFTVCDIRIHCRAGPVVVFRSSCFNGQAAEACSYAALIGPVAAIRTHRRTGLAAVVDSHCCTGPAAAIVAPTLLLKFAATVEYRSSC